MSNLKAVIFDMDGVIIDSEPIHHQVNKEIYQELEIEVSDQEYEKFIGVSNSDHWRTLKEKHNLEDDIENLVNRQNEKNIEHLSKTAQEPIIGVLYLLEELEANNIKVGLASSSALRYIKAVLEKFAIDDYFSVMVSGEEMDRGKPHPDIFLEAAKQLGAEPEECVVIEDSANGVKGAKSAGMKCIAYQNPNSGNQDLSFADYKVDSLKKITLNDLKELIDKA